MISFVMNSVLWPSGHTTAPTGRGSCPSKAGNSACVRAISARTVIFTPQSGPLQVGRGTHSPSLHRSPGSQSESPAQAGRQSLAVSSQISSPAQGAVPLVHAYSAVQTSVPSQNWPLSQSASVRHSTSTQRWLTHASGTVASQSPWLSHAGPGGGGFCGQPARAISQTAVRLEHALTRRRPQPLARGSFPERRPRRSASRAGFLGPLCRLEHRSPRRCPAAGPSADVVAQSEYAPALRVMVRMYIAVLLRRARRLFGSFCSATCGETLPVVRSCGAAERRSPGPRPLLDAPSRLAMFQTVCHAAGRKDLPFF